MDSLAQQAQQLFGIHLTGRQMVALLTLERELIAWSERVNLTAIRDSEAIRTKHFLDSFSCVLAWKGEPPGRVIDVGTGAGFPGLPLKILYPSMQLTLVESVGKKTAFCRHMVETLQLDHVEIVTGRAEVVGQDPAHRESYDCAIARAVANMPVLAEYLLPLTCRGGIALAQKGSSAPAEAHAAEKAFQILGGRLRELVPVQLPGIAEERYLVVMEKVAATPPQYPRLPGTPAKKPL
jgi:16S rRNA (guanine527-N7)-methyltransferase